MILKYVPHTLIDRWLEVGWMFARPIGEHTLDGCHGYWSALMRWPCDCTVQIPGGKQWT